VLARGTAEKYNTNCAPFRYLKKKIVQYLWHLTLYVCLWPPVVLEPFIFSYNTGRTQWFNFILSLPANRDYLPYLKTYDYFTSVSLNISGFDPRQRQQNRPLTSVSRPALGPTQPPVQWVPGVLSPGVKRCRGVMLTTHPYLVLRSWMSRSYTSSPPSSSMACRGTALLYYL
jgi:hypothetical protein